jgi:hypothetical protein
MVNESLKRLKEDHQWVTNTISNSVRVISFGVIAAIWAVTTTDGISLQTTNWLGISTSLSAKFVFIFASGALLTDILHYIAFYRMNKIAYIKYENRLRDVEEGDKEITFSYNEENLGCLGLFLYRLRPWYRRFNKFDKWCTLIRIYLAI